MREIKFEYIFKEKYRGKLHRRVFTLGEFEDIEMEILLLENNWEIVALRQWTGLKDKNGKEIYEGDVYRVANNQQYEIVWLTELEYEEKCAGWGLKQLRGEFPPYLIDDWAVTHGEIIGNIYENPELLKTV